MNRITAHYLAETAFPRRQAADMMAGEQSVGTFVRVSGETPERVARYGARVERLEVVGEIEHPSLPGAKNPEGATYRRVEVTLSFPLDTIGTSLVGLWTAVAGNLFELSPFSGLKLIGLELPPEFTDAHPGPRFGVAGTRPTRRRLRAPAHRNYRQAERRAFPRKRRRTWYKRFARRVWTLSKTTSCKVTRPIRLSRREWRR